MKPKPDVPDEDTSNPNIDADSDCCCWCIDTDDRPGDERGVAPCDLEIKLRDKGTSTSAAASVVLDRNAGDDESFSDWKC